MKSLFQAVADYMAMRRGLGYKLNRYATQLREFVAFLDGKGSSHITTDLAVEWVTQQAHHRPHTWARRLSIVRGFAWYWCAIDPASEVPPPGLWRSGKPHARPYLYSEAEIQKLLQAARKWSGIDPLRPWTSSCLFGLLAVTGMRLGEVLNLRVEDVDLLAGIITVRWGKFGRTRLIPLHTTTCQVLSDYAQHRDRRYGVRADSYFFVNRYGNRVLKIEIQKLFLELSRQIGLRAPAATQGPRLHDFRHRFAVETLLRWYRNGEDPKRLLPRLATYLGHVCVSGTYWYLSAAPELMAEAAKRLEHNWAGEGGYHG